MLVVRGYMYLEMLTEMIALLDKGKHEHWSKWFQLAQLYYVVVVQ